MSDAVEWTEVRGLADLKFDETVAEIESLTSTINSLEETRKGLKQTVFELLQKNKQESVRVGASRVTIVKGRAGARKIDGEKLAKKGVSLAVIEACTVQGPDGEPYLKVTTRVEDGE